MDGNKIPSMLCPICSWIMRRIPEVILSTARRERGPVTHPYPFYRGPINESAVPLGFLSRSQTSRAGDIFDALSPALFFDQ